MPSTVDYAGEATRRGARHDIPLRIALACAITPAAFGTAIIALWLLTRFDALQLFGFFNILLGLACTLIGGLALITYFARDAASRSRPKRAWLLRGLLTGLLLVANFPLCALYIWIAQLYTIRVVNATGVTIESFVVADPSGQVWELGPIAAGGRTRRMLPVEGEGSVVFNARVNRKPVSGVVEGYVTSGMTGESRTVTVNPDGTSSVR